MSPLCYSRGPSCTLETPPSILETIHPFCPRFLILFLVLFCFLWKCLHMNVGSFLLRWGSHGSSVQLTLRLRYSSCPADSVTSVIIAYIFQIATFRFPFYDFVIFLFHQSQDGISSLCCLKTLITKTFSIFYSLFKYLSLSFACLF